MKRGFKKKSMHNIYYSITNKKNALIDNFFGGWFN